MTRFCFVILLSVLTFQCKQQAIENATDDFLPPQKLSKLESKKLEEISGIVSSMNNPGNFWGLNDSGNAAKVFLFDQELKIKFTCTLDKLVNRDWEDIAIGPGPDTTKNYLYIAEIGDNRGKYPLKYIYRFEEPKLQAGSAKALITDFDTLIFELPDKPKDTETLLLDPVTKDLFVFSKREEPVWIYQLKSPTFSSDTVTATKLYAIPFTQIVGGDVSPDGKKVLLKNYEHVYYWDNPTGKPLVELFKDKPFEVPYEIEPQGESITWDLQGKSFYTLSEKNVGKDTFLFYYQAK
ncbi:MAG TPA: hypothetical protein VD884_04240 [Ohtaekwangia sp.]|nr:hypothetical protein [Ohtaekwangia sp.]